MRPLHLVVLVDESSSIDQQAMEREKEAALLIALGEFAPGSTVSVTGFASDNDGDGPQTPVDKVCRPSVVRSAADRESLSTCVQTLRNRKPGEGDGTDHVSALRAALFDLKDAPADQAKIVFLLTDGNLNVGESPLWGKDNQADLRNTAARQALTGELDAARRAGAQVWPLGFGGNIDRGRLDELASGGSQATCGAGVPPPKAAVIGSAEDVLRTMLDAFSSARCAGKGTLVETTSKPGGTVEAALRIPEIATDGSIVVFRRDPRIRVEYVDPQGRVVPKTGQSDASQFQVSGEQGPVEALRVVNPEPGEWRIRLTTPEDGPTQKVASTVVWQGAARALLTVDNNTPSAGGQVTVSVSLQTRRGTITDPASLAGLSFAAAVEGDGFDRVAVTLADDGGAPDRVARDGVFTGVGAVPASATGALRFTGSVSGIGVQGDERAQNGQVPRGAPDVRAVARLADDAPFVPPGGSLAGEVDVTNDSGRARKIRVVVKESGPGTVVSVTPAVHDVAPSGDSRLRFALEFAATTAIGVNSGVLEVVDDADPGPVLYRFQFTAAVSHPPTLLQRLLWLWISLAVAVAVLIGYLLVRGRKRRRERDVRGLQVQVVGGGYLQAPDRPAQAFRFALTRAGDTVVPGHPKDHDETYELRRSAQGGVELVHDGRTTPMPPEQPVEVAPDVRLTFKDARRVGRAHREPRQRPVGAAHRPAEPGPQPPTTARVDDDLL